MLAIAFMAASFFIGFSLFSYSISKNAPHAPFDLFYRLNGGKIGSYFSQKLFLLFGSFSYLFPIALAYVSFFNSGKEASSKKTHYLLQLLGFVMIIVTTSSLNASLC